MNAEELMRFAQEEDKKRKNLGADRHLLDQIERERRIIKSSLGSIPVEDLRAKFAQINIGLNAIKSESLVQAAIFGSIQEANRSVLKVFGEVAKDSVLLELTKILGSRSAEWIDFKNSLDPQIQIRAFLNSHLSQIAQNSLLAQNVLVNIDFDRIATAVSVAAEFRASFSKVFVDFSYSYKNLFKSFELPDTSLFTLPPAITESPTIEYFNEIELLESTIEGKEESEHKEERQIVRTEIRESTNNSVIIQLKEINPDWIPVLEGSKQALNSTNPDKIRHCLTSLRELFTAVMHHLSPDKQIRAWSTSPDDFDKNCPTRKARLRFIAQGINHGAFIEFVEKDIEATLAAIKIFQVGTHSIKSKLTETQVSALIARIEGTISFLLLIANYKE